MEHNSIEQLLQLHKPSTEYLYLLAEPNSTFLEDIYRLLPESETWPVMLTTEFDAVARYGPHLTRLPEDTDITTLWHFAKAAGWQFYLLTSSMTIEAASAQLAQRLKVRFGGKREGLLRYYDLSIADYLFRYSHDTDFASWMGAFTQAYWYCSPSWSDAHPQWLVRKVHTALLEHPFSLPTSIQQALERYQLDNLISRFIESKNIANHPSTWWLQQYTHIEHAESQAICSDVGLLEYLALCHDAPMTFPIEQALQTRLSLAGTETEKLATLKQWLALQTRVES